MKKWENIRHNSILKGDGFYISYNDQTTSDASQDLCEIMLGTMLQTDVKRQEETALCVNREYYILNGDYRKEYEDLIDKGLDACMKFYEKNKEKHQSIWSTDYEDNLVQITNDQKR